MENLNLHIVANLQDNIITLLQQFIQKLMNRQLIVNVGVVLRFSLTIAF